MEKETQTTDIIQIEHLKKSFGEVKAVNNLSFRVRKGELFAFLGVNGAGNYLRAASGRQRNRADQGD